MASFRQVDENDPAEMVVVHEPNVSNWMGSIHPDGSLYEQPVDLEAARREHAGFRAQLRECGVEVRTVREILLDGCSTNVQARVALEDFAATRIRYVFDASAGAALSAKEQYYLGEEYKRKCVEKMSDEQLVDVIHTNPTIELTKADQDTALLAVNYTFQPLVNLVFTRDQVITTIRGIVCCALSSERRAREVAVMEFCYRKLGLHIAGHIPAPGTLEGGDFFMAGRDLCLVGIGLRSNMHAIQHLMDHDLTGTRRIAVVKDFFDSDQQRMHLDTVCNIVAPKVMLMLETIIGADSPLRRLVDEYTRTRGPDGKITYVVTRRDVEYSQYLIDNGYVIIPLTHQNQCDYGCNGLNLGNSTVLMVDNASAKTLARSPHFDGQIRMVDFRNITNMYGSLHCCSQVVSRRSRTARGDSDDDDDGINGHVVPPARNLASLNAHSRFLMMSPNSFAVLEDSIADNINMSRSLQFQETVSSQDDNRHLRDIRSHRRQLRSMITREISRLHAVLTNELGASVFLFTHNTHHKTPEAVFIHDPLSTHSAAETGGEPTLVLYSMYSRARKSELRPDIIDFLKDIKYQRVVDLSDGPALENGALVRDVKAKVAFMNESKRATREGGQAWADALGYEFIPFRSIDKSPAGDTVQFFHTSLLLFLGHSVAVVCAEAIAPEFRAVVCDRLRALKDTVIEINLAQVFSFCAQMVEVRDKTDSPVLVMSQTAHTAYTAAQLAQLGNAYRTVIDVDVSTLEHAGGGSISGVLGPLA